MSLFVFHETTVDRSDTETTKFNWKPIFFIAVILLAIGVTIWFFTSRPGNDIAPSTTNPAPAQNPIQAPVQIPSAAINEPAPAGVVKITAEKLIRELAADHTKYRQGTVFQVSGILKWQKKRFPNQAGNVYFFLGPAVQTKDYPLGVIIRADVEKESGLIKALTAFEEDREIVVQGAYFTFDNSYLQGTILENVSLISVSPR